MTEIIHDTDNSNGGLIAVVLVVVIAIGGFLVWRFSDRAPADKTSDTINLEITNPTAPSPTP